MYVIKAKEGDEEFTIRREDGFLSVLVNGTVEYKYDELCHFPPVMAMFERIKELEMAVGQVLDGSLRVTGVRNADGMRAYQNHIRIDDRVVNKWRERLRDVLEQKS